jgi:hypothetical protein
MSEELFPNVSVTVGGIVPHYQYKQLEELFPTISKKQLEKLIPKLSVQEKTN